MARHGSSSRGKASASSSETKVKSHAERKRRVRDDDEASDGEVTPGTKDVKEVEDEGEVVVEEGTEKRVRRDLGKLVDYLIRVSKAWEMEEKDNVESAVRRTKKLETLKKSLAETEYRFLVFPFRRLLQKNLTSIKRGPRYDAWLREVPTKKNPRGAEVRLSFPNPSGRKAQPLEVKLSMMYLDAIEMCDRMQMYLNSSKDTEKLEETYASSEQLIFPDVIRLYLWKIFAAIADDVEEEGTGQQIRQSLETLEMDLGIASGGDLFRRFVRAAMDDDEGPFATMIAMVGNVVKSMVPGVGQYVDGAVELVQAFSHGEISFDEVISKVIEMVTDAFPSLNQRADGREAVNEIKSTVTRTLGGMTRDGDKTLKPMETIAKFTEIINKLKNSEFMRAKFAELQTELGHVNSLADVKNLDPLSIVKIVTREVENPEFVKEIEAVTGKNIDHSEAIVLITKLNKLYEAIVKILAEEGGVNNARKPRQIDGPESDGDGRERTLVVRGGRELARTDAD